MHIIKLLSVHCDNFKGFKSFDILLGDKLTRISGINGIGKSSIASVIMWVLFGVDYDLTSNPKVRREISGMPVNDVPVIGEITMSIDGKETIARKVQKRSTKKDGSYSDDNTYSINGVEKNLKDFVSYFNFNLDDMLMCVNIGAFLARKPKEMRDFLFGLPGDVFERDIILKYPELAKLVELSEKYSTDEIAAMNKASIVKLNKEIAGYPGRIDEVNRQIVEGIDTAELELQKNSLQEQIAQIEHQEDDSLAQSKEYDAMTADIMDLKFKTSDIERIGNESLNGQKKDIQKRIDNAEILFNMAIQSQKMAELDLERIQKDITQKKAEKEKLLENYNAMSAEVFRTYEPLPQLTPDDFVCPTCGQELPENARNDKQSTFAEQIRKHRKKYDEEMVSWKKHQDDLLLDINHQGIALKENIRKLETEIITIELAVKAAKDAKINANRDKGDAQTELATLPVRADLSANQEYEALCREILAKEEALKAMNTGADYRSQLRAKKAGLQVELDSVKETIAKTSKNIELEERLDELRNEHVEKEQSKANCEKIIDLLENLDKKKNELLVDEINGRFKRVKWKLFESAKNGSYKKDFCQPTIDGYTIHDNTANKGRIIEAKIDIATSIQQIVGINCPIILDDAESLDKENINRILSDVDCQTIILMVGESQELKIEAV